MPKFRTKPVVIDAVCFIPEEPEDYLSFLDAHDPNNRVQLASEFRPFGSKLYEVRESLEIQTLEGVMSAEPYDWIIKGVNGEICPCKPDIFEKTYEPVTSET